MKKFFFFLSFISFTILTNAQLTAEQESIRKTFIDFLNFYKRNETKFYSFKLYKGVGENNDPPYKIQWKEVDKYCTWLRASVPYVGETYIKNERSDFKFYDSSFKADPEEEIPMGFDFDRWTGSQEDIQYMIEWYTSSKNKYEVIITGDKAVLRIGSELMEGVKEMERTWSEVNFVKEKGKWKMADNIHPYDPEETSEG